MKGMKKSMGRYHMIVIFNGIVLKGPIASVILSLSFFPLSTSTYGMGKSLQAKNKLMDIEKDNEVHSI